MIEARSDGRFDGTGPAAPAGLVFGEHDPEGGRVDERDHVRLVDGAGVRRAGEERSGRGGRRAPTGRRLGPARALRARRRGGRRRAHERPAAGALGEAARAAGTRRRSVRSPASSAPALVLVDIRQGTRVRLGQRERRRRHRRYHHQSGNGLCRISRHSNRRQSTEQRPTAVPVLSRRGQSLATYVRDK